MGRWRRVRRQERPRYGFYVDHIVDVLGSVALMCGLGFSGLLHWATAMAMLIAFLVLSSESYLATYTLKCFELSQGIFGPTEIRILLAMGCLAATAQPVCDGVWAQDAALRSGRGDWDARDGGDGVDGDGAAHGATLQAGAAGQEPLKGADVGNLKEFSLRG